MSTVQEIDAMGVDAGTVVAPEDAVKARGYWEQIWRRLKRDRFALAGGAFIVFMFLLCPPAYLALSFGCFNDGLIACGRLGCLFPGDLPLPAVGFFYLLLHIVHCTRFNGPW